MTRQSFLFLLIIQTIVIPPGLTLLNFTGKVTYLSAGPDHHVFVGGENFIAKLDDNMTQVSYLSIGPVTEDKFCLPDQAPCDNTVQFIQTVDQFSAILVYGSAYQRSCTLHSFDDLEDWSCVIPAGEENNKNDKNDKGNKMPYSVISHVIPQQASLCQNRFLDKNNNRSHSCRSSESFKRKRKLDSRQQGVSNDKEKNCDKSGVQGMYVAGKPLGNQGNRNFSYILSRRDVFYNGNYRMQYTESEGQVLGFNVDTSNTRPRSVEYRFSFVKGNFSYFIFDIQVKDRNKVIWKTMISRVDNNKLIPYSEGELKCKVSRLSRSHL